MTAILIVSEPCHLEDQKIYQHEAGDHLVQLDGTLRTCWRKEYIWAISMEQQRKGKERNRGIALKTIRRYIVLISNFDDKGTRSGYPLGAAQAKNLAPMQ